MMEIRDIYNCRLKKSYINNNQIKSNGVICSGKLVNWSTYQICTVSKVRTLENDMNIWCLEKSLSKPLSHYQIFFSLLLHVSFIFKPTTTAQHHYPYIITFHYSNTKILLDIWSDVEKYIYFWTQISSFTAC